MTRHSLRTSDAPWVPSDRATKGGKLLLVEQFVAHRARVGLGVDAGYVVCVLCA